MHYTTTVPFDGHTATAFDLAVSALTAIGFRIVAKDASSLEATGPGMNSTNQNALVGASRLRITRSAGELAIDAELGGAQRLARFVAVFPLSLVLVLCAVLSIVFSLTFNHYLWVIPVVAVAGANALLWLILGPILGRVIRGRTCRAIDVLLNNMAVTGKTE